MAPSNKRNSESEPKREIPLPSLFKDQSEPDGNYGLPYRYIPKNLEFTYEENENDLPVFKVRCGGCGSVHKGRYFHVGWCEPIRYCSKCANIHHRVGDYDPDPPICSCGGVFDSTDLKCPECGEIIKDRELQLAYQQYDVEGVLKVEKASIEQVKDWYNELRKIGYFNGDTLFIQIKDALIFNENGKPEYHKVFEEK